MRVLKQARIPRLERNKFRRRSGEKILIGAVESDKMGAL